MKYITIVIVIISYFFILSLGLNMMLSDISILSIQPEGNTSFFIMNTSSVNMSTSEIPEGVSLKSFPLALKVMFSFRTPIPSAIPKTAATIISFINWLVMILLGISLYRIINPLA